MSYEIEISTLNVPCPDGLILGYVASPKIEGPLPCVIVIHEVYGIRGHVDDVCNRLAREGYHAVAPMLFTRHGDVHALTDFNAIHAISKAVADAEVIRDLDSTFDFLATSNRIDPTRIGITGFCWGGRQVWLYANHNPRLRVGVAWYGGQLVAEPTALRPRNPLDIADTVHIPILGLYGGSDAIIPLPTIEQMQNRLASVQSTSRIEVFPDAPHGFHAKIRPASFHAEAAQKGWEMMIEWFSEHGMLSRTKGSLT
jgi:carboxymethylenebutenolidase